MRFIDKYNCILCKYNKYNRDGDSCFDHMKKDKYGYPIEECKSLSNIYYRTLIKFFPFKQIDDFCTKISYRKEEKYTKEMDEKYGNCALENDDIKFIWGVKSWDDLSRSEANLYTMNDIDITYDKKNGEYMLGIETAYAFKDYASERNYLKRLLKDFEKYMDDKGLCKFMTRSLFMRNPYTNITANSIEELYVDFKIFVDGFCAQKRYEGELSDFMNKLSDENWVSIKKVGLPNLEEVSITNFSSVYKSKEVLIQTKRGERFVAYCEKEVYANKRWVDEIKWFVYGTGGRKMRVMSKVVAWMELPEKYKGE